MTIALPSHGAPTATDSPPAFPTAKSTFIASQATEPTFACSMRAPPRSSTWSPDGRRFAYSVQGEVRIGSLPVTQRAYPTGRRRCLLPSVVSLSPDGKFLAGADRDGSLPIWDVDSGQVATRLPGHPAPVADQIGEADRAATALLWSPDSKRLASLRLSDGGLRVWDVKTAHTPDILPVRPQPVRCAGERRLAAGL